MFSLSSTFLPSQDPDQSVAFLTSALLCDRGVWGASAKHRIVPFIFTRVGSWEQNAPQQYQSSGTESAIPAPELPVCKNRSLIWQRDKCPEESEQKAISRAHNRTENRTARWGIVAADSWVHSVCQESYCTGNCGVWQDPGNHTVYSLQGITAYFG